MAARWPGWKELVDVLELEAGLLAQHPYGRSQLVVALDPSSTVDAGAPPAEAARIMEMIRAADALLEK